MSEVTHTVSFKEDPNILALVKVVGTREEFLDAIAMTAKVIMADKMQETFPNAKLLAIGTHEGKVINEIWFVKDWRTFKHPLAKEVNL